ncbi:hypothetical protein TIFTF001_022813 [Ficus carica]|uniref:Uncharacterized protein n=1 Tax=Ficus carica TaxID=3494 RepID=A0AA88DEV7_FICCA|nr:hypothetical protein TIFTF001_022813 [Ficus carica]
MYDPLRDPDSLELVIDLLVAFVDHCLFLLRRSRTKVTMTLRSDLTGVDETHDRYDWLHDLDSLELVVDLLAAFVDRRLLLLRHSWTGTMAMLISVVYPNKPYI